MGREVGGLDGGGSRETRRSKLSLSLSFRFALGRPPPSRQVSFSQVFFSRICELLPSSSPILQNLHSSRKKSELRVGELRSEISPRGLVLGRLPLPASNGQLLSRMHLSSLLYIAILTTGAFARSWHPEKSEYGRLPTLREQEAIEFKWIQKRFALIPKILEK